MSETDTLNPAALERLVKLGGDKFASDMVTLFLSYGGSKVAEARQVQQSGNLAGVADAVHPLKSSAGNVGATRVQALATSLEEAAKAGKADQVTAQMDELEQAFAEVKTLLESELTRIKARQQ